ncbi:hypothetical protein [Candidatus Rhabdochlamydia porcellionis]|jgi:hypothetical protein|uniref:Uncharacterized protein n=1 Tax=Candidatus Rhabdochlamydia porcellionis TaxID=225148 RepID=A0ABX8YZQ3_9BACT|nr:hypothetical protein [Candidatus Rhabdochlamydia porcellionis]QZA58490.1 hypothetical protein RHAB15C_0000364 [Candidatus Rhabdochlamydia porcellionis]
METPPRQNSETFSVGQAFNLNIFFLLGIWPLVEPKVLEEEQKLGLYSFFFIDICSTYDCHAEWNEAIRLVLHVPKEEQRTLQLSLSDIFSCIMEFCKIFNERCNFKIAYTVDLLESMRKNPKNHEREWAIWQDMVKEIADDHEGKNNYFNWADTLSPWKME